MSLHFGWRANGLQPPAEVEGGAPPAAQSWHAAKTHAAGVRAIHLTGPQVVSCGNDGMVKIQCHPARTHLTRKLPTERGCHRIRLFKLSRTRLRRTPAQVVDVDCSKQRLVCASVDGVLTVADFGVDVCRPDESLLLESTMRELSLADSADERAAALDRARASARNDEATLRQLL